MRPIYLVILIAGLLSVYGNVRAEITMIGAGNLSCGTWLDARKNAAKSASPAFEQWVVGFISGAAWAGNEINKIGDPLGPTDADGVYYWIDEYCRTHAAESLKVAAEAFIRRRQ